MQMSTSFKRSVGGGVYTALGADGAAAVPPTYTPGGQDNLLVLRPMNNVGAPVQRIAALYKYEGAGPAIALTAQLWMYDGKSLGWYEVGAPKSMTVNRATYFDCVSIADAVQVGSDSQPSGGSLQCVLVVLAGAAPAGTYTFAIAGDLSVTV
jgi:hypothetical protein